MENPYENQEKRHVPLFHDFKPRISPKSHGVCPERPRLQHRSQVQGQGHLDAVPVPRQVPELQEMTVQKGAGTPELILGTGENRGFSMWEIGEIMMNGWLLKWWIMVINDESSSYHYMPNSGDNNVSLIMMIIIRMIVMAITIIYINLSPQHV